MSTFKNCITAQFVANVVYSVKPTFDITFLFRISIYNAITMLRTGFKQFFLQPFPNREPVYFDEA